MMSEKIILTYKRKHASSNVDPAHANDGNLSLDSAKRVPVSAELNERLEGDKKPPTQRRCECAAHAGEIVEELDKCKECGSIQGLKGGVTKYSQKSSPDKEIFEKDASSSNNSDLAFVDSVLTSANETPHNKGNAGSQSLDLDIPVRSNPVSFDSIEWKSSSLSTEESILKTFNSGKKGSPLEAKPEMLSQKMVHKECSGTPLRTFCRRAKKIKLSETGVHGNLKVVQGEGGEGSEYVQRKMLDVTTDQSKQVPVLGKDNLDSSRRNLNVKDMVKNLLEDASREYIPGSLVENKKSEGSPVGCTDRSNLIIKEGKSVLGNTPIGLGSHCCSNDSLKESSSEINHMDNQFKLPETSTSISEEPGIDLTGTVQKPVVRSTSVEVPKAGNSVGNLYPSDGVRPDIDLNELASNKTTADSMYETNKSMGHENLFGSRGLCNHAVEEGNGSSKGAESLETMERQTKRVLHTSMQEVDINCSPAFRESNTFCQTSMKLSPPDQIMPDFLDDMINQAASLKGNAVRNVGDSIPEGQQGTQATKAVCTDFLSSIHRRPENIIDNIKNYPCIAAISNLEGSGHIYEVQLPWKPSDSNSSIFRHKQILDDIVTSSRMLNKMQGYYLGNCRRYSGGWSEEELDSLWVGVRRHGRGNWNAMLRDPKLHFTGWKLAEDLAERWDVEQTRLLNTPLVQPVRSLELDHSPSSVMCSRLLSNSLVNSLRGSYLSEFQNFRNETGLSLGGLYLKEEGKSTRDNDKLSDFTFHPGAVSSYNYRGHQGHTFSTNVGTSYHRLGKAQKNGDELGLTFLEQNSVKRSPGGEHQVTSLQASTDLPHWLKGVLDTPATPNEQAVLPGVSTLEQAMASHSRDQRVIPPFSFPAEQLPPPKDARRGILKRRGICGNGTRILGSSTHKSTEECKASDSNILDLNQSSSEAMEQSNLVILDSDASSEETISDDQSGRR